MGRRKLRIGFFSFTGCEGCQFTVLFLDDLMKILLDFDVQYFHLIKEKNREVSFDVAFIEGAITTKKESEKLSKIRKKSKYLVAIGACACEGGVPAMRNFLEKKELEKYVFSQSILEGSIPAQPVSNFVKVDYFMRGCPILKKEFISVLESFRLGVLPSEYEGNVCAQCERKGTPNCFLAKKIPCTGSITKGGCKALCIKQNIPCMLCRGPIEKSRFSKEVKLFESLGLSQKDIFSKLSRFRQVEVENYVSSDKKDNKKGSR